MKKIILSVAVFSLVMMSCGESKKKVEAEAIDSEVVKTETVKTTDADKAKKMALMTKATSLPHYMNIALKGKKDLSINKDQEQKLNLLKKEKNPQGLKMAKEIDALEKKIYQMSLNNTSAEEILSQLNKSLAIRKDIANLKTDCRDEMKTILTDEQWNTLIEMYKNKMPFNNKTDMMELIAHVNPVPNYMQIIKEKEIKLDESQESKITEWQGEKHSIMMELAKKVNKLEQDVYNLSLTNASKEEIIKNVEEIATTKTEIVTIKTECRDNIFSILNKEQIEILTFKR